jgi:hypothetical protein
MNARDHVIQYAYHIFPKQPGGRVPRAIVAISQPAPVWRGEQHHSGRHCQRAGEVSDAGIDRNDEVEL